MIVQFETVSVAVREAQFVAPQRSPITIQITGEEIAQALDDFLRRRGVEIQGPRTVRVDGELAQHATAYVIVDPSGSVKINGTQFQYGS